RVPARRDGDKKQVGEKTSTASNRFGSRVAPQRRPKPVSPSGTQPADDLVAYPYPPRIPDGEYLAICTRTYWDRESRGYGKRIYLYCRIFDGEHAEKELRMFCRPSSYPTSNYYRAWAIANNGAPRSRNTRLSRKVFLGKLFRVRVTTVKPRHRIMCPDGKVRQGNLLPEHLWYSKVECLLSLEVTNQWIRDFPSDTNGAIPISVTKILVNPFRQREIARGGVG